jgi:predicted nucleic acid-binding protein
MILVDTSVWVRSLRRQPSEEREILRALLMSGEVASCDLILAEVLQGASSDADFADLLQRLPTGTHFLHVTEDTWIAAAELSYRLRRRGLRTALSDCVIAALALTHDIEVYSIDRDFSRVPALRLYRPV